MSENDKVVSIDGVSGQGGDVDKPVNRVFVAETDSGALVGVPVTAEGRSAQNPLEVFKSMVWIDAFYVKIVATTREGAKFTFEPVNMFNRKSNVSYINPARLGSVYEADDDFKREYLSMVMRVKAARSGIVTPSQAPIGSVPIRPDLKPVG